MTEQPDFTVDPAPIAVGSWVTYQCPECSFGVEKQWLSPDGRVFGDPKCWAHDRPVKMRIVKVDEREAG